MAIPDFQTLMLPLLKLASDGKTHYIHDAVEKLANQYSLTDEEKTRLLPSGQQPVFYNRVGWSRTYLKKSGLLDDPQRGYFTITERGLDVLKEKPSRIDMNYLKRFPEYIEFKQRPPEITGPGNGDDDFGGLTPEEALEEAYQRIREDLSNKLLEYVVNSTPGFFEKLVVQLLVKMGYGGSQRDAARAVGQSGDEGIDGIIDEDRLGLDTIYVQAKRWNLDNPVGRPEIQKFVGALEGKRARKGIFLTTSRFTNDAHDYSRTIKTSVVLIDGARLTELMIDFGIGVSTQTIYEIKSIDTDYFGEISVSL